MNRKFTAAAASALAALVSLPLVTVHAQQPINVTVDGGVVNFGAQPPVEQFGTVLVPLRGVFEKLGATVAYDGGTRSILAVRGPTTVTLKLGSRDATVNNTPRTLSVPAQAINGSTLVPLRFVSEALGAQVQWQQSSRTVIVSSSGGSTAPPVNPPVSPPSGARPRDLRYGKINIAWDFNSINLRDTAGIEARIRRELNLNAGNPNVVRRPDSDGVLNVNVTLRRANPNNVRADVRLALVAGGRGPATITGSDSAVTPSRDDTIDGQVVLQAVRNARRELGGAATQYLRNPR